MQYMLFEPWHCSGHGSQGLSYHADKPDGSHSASKRERESTCDLLVSFFRKM